MPVKTRLYKRDIFRAQATVTDNQVQIQIWSLGAKKGHNIISFATTEWHPNQVDQQKMLARKLQGKFPNDDWDWLSLNLDAVRRAAVEIMGT